MGKCRRVRSRTNVSDWKLSLSTFTVAIGLAWTSIQVIVSRTFLWSYHFNASSTYDRRSYCRYDPQGYAAAASVMVGT